MIIDDILIVFDYRNHFYRFDNGNNGRSLFMSDAYYQVLDMNTSMSIEKSSVDNPSITYGLNDADYFDSNFCFCQQFVNLST
jgi:hypothetical protein